MENIDQSLQYFGLVMARIIGLFFTAPVMSSQVLSYRSRTGFAFLTAVILYPVSANYLPELPSSSAAYLLAVLNQTFIGVLIGFFILLIFSSFQIIGEIFSLQMGLSFSEVLDPQSQISLPILGTLKNAIGMLIFLSLPFQIGDYYASAIIHMIRSISLSFQAIPEIVLSRQVQGGILQHADEVFGLMFITALKIGIPLIGILFITSLTLGILGKAAPQMNLISMGIQFNISIGIIVLIFSYARNSSYYEGFIRSFISKNRSHVSDMASRKLLNEL